MADKLEAHLFVAAIQKHHRTLEVLTVESVGDYYKECFFPRDQERIFLLRHERDVRASSRDRGEHLCRQRFHCRIVEDRGLAQVNPYDRSLGLRFPWRMECEPRAAAGTLPASGRAVSNVLGVAIRESEDLEFRAIHPGLGSLRCQLQISARRADKKRAYEY